ncbi:MAG: 1,4-dihydroxy-2-naphthoate polyprenyltransferase [Bacteroidota bacterium]
MNIKAWLKAFRLRTLPLSLSSIGMGTFLAAWKGFFDSSVFAACVLTTVLLQILSNLANDFGDTQHGADHDEREGPLRSVQTGEISAQQMKTAIILFVILSLISGVGLLFIAFEDTKNILIFLGIGITCILAAIFYTMGKKPYGYMGLGDISVLLFFGIVGVGATYYLFARSFDLFILLPAISTGLFAVAVLNINNIRDIKSDTKAGKMSIPVRLGPTNARLYHWFLLVLAIGLALVFTFIHYEGPLQLAFLLVTPLVLKNALGIQRETTSSKLDPYLKQMALTSLLFMVIFGSGLLMT